MSGPAAVVVLGALAGVGVALAAAGLWPARPGLAQALAAMRQPTPAPPEPVARRVRLLAAPLARWGLPRPAVRADLAILDRPAAKHLADQTIAVAAGLLGPPVAVAVLAAGGTQLAATAPLWLSLAGGVGGFVLADTVTHGEAERRRAELRHTLSGLLDLVTVCLAGGAGVEQALDDAAAVADGWAADRLRRALHAARAMRVPPWQTLGELGEAADVPELAELAAAMALAGTEGARVRASLSARAATLRTHQATEAETKANAATERMSLPVMLLGTAYLVFLLYPALAVLDTV